MKFEKILLCDLEHFTHDVRNLYRVSIYAPKYDELEDLIRNF